MGLALKGLSSVAKLGNNFSMLPIFAKNFIKDATGFLAPADITLVSI